MTIERPAFERLAIAACDADSVLDAVRRLAVHIAADSDAQELQYRCFRELVDDAALVGGPRYTKLVAVHDLLLRDGLFRPPALDPSYLHYFEEAFYLERHPDVASAVRAGRLRNGFQHFVENGAREGRKPHGWRRQTRLAPPSAFRAPPPATGRGDQPAVVPANGPAPGRRTVLAPHERIGVNFIAYHSANLGLGVSARAYHRLFVESGLDVCPIDVPVPGGRSMHDTSYAHRFLPLDLPAPHDVNLFLMNPKDIEDQRALRCPAISFENKINAAVVFWELPRLPLPWTPILETLDILLTPSPFLKYGMLQDLARPVLRDLEHPMWIPDGVRADRTRWNIPRDRVAFVCSFEMASDVNRKNPFAALRAFERAFTARDSVLLIVKVNNAKWAPEFEPHLRTLREFTERNPNIRLLEEVLSYVDVLSLFASCDALVSLHRAEGLGLCLMEAMMLGKPVIATAWSGSMAFTTEQNSCLVGYELVPVRSATQPAYGANVIRDDATWADARIDEAAAWMRRLAADPELRRRIGTRAAADMAAYQARIDVREFTTAVRHVAERRGTKP